MDGGTQSGERVILVTGFSGFLGQYVTAELLRACPGARVLALVRPASLERARALAATLAAGEPAARLELVAGNVEQPELGLPAAGEVADRLAAIFHLAAVYDLGTSLEPARRANVEGTRNVLALAARCRQPVRVHYTSTCYVAGTHAGVFREDQLDVGQRFLNHYDRTKFAAEQLVRAYSSRVPITVYRPAIIVGHSQTGHTTKFDGPYFVMRTMARLPRRCVFPRIGTGRQPVNLVPVDFVARAMIALAGLPDSVGRTYHLADPCPLAAIELERALMDLLGRRLLPVRVPVALVRLLLRPPAVHRLVGMPPAALAYFDYRALFDTTWARRHLEGTGIRCPPVASYLPRLVEYWRRCQAGERPADSQAHRLPHPPPV